MQALLEYLDKLSKQLPVTYFAFIGSIIDEVLAILPSIFIPITAGSMCALQNKSLFYFFLVAFFGTLGKTLATILTYFVSDKLEDILTTGVIGKILDLDKNEIENYGKYFNNSLKKDFYIMLILRVLPFMPTLPVSFIAGTLKINLKVFISATFLGTFVRFLFYMFIGYKGSEQFGGILDIFDKINTFFEVLILGLLFTFVYFYLRKHKDKIISNLKKFINK